MRYRCPKHQTKSFSHKNSSATQMPVVATKNGKTRTFDDRTWELLGKNKEGWVPNADTTVKNIARPAKPSTGEPPVQRVTNVAKTPPPVVDNTAPAPAAPAPKAPENTTLTAFRAAAAGLSAGIIKDFFDQQTPQVTYNKRANKAELIDQLATVLDFDIKKFQQLFS